MLRWALPLGIMSWMLVGSLVLLALYEWKILVALALLPLFFVIGPPLRRRLRSHPLANHRKEDLG